MTNEMPLAGKVALVTGASRGIGAEVARQLAGAGADVFIAAHDEEDKLQAAVASVAEAREGTRVEALNIDLSVAEAAEKLTQETLSRLGRIDILANNAAIRIRKPFGAFSAEDFDKVVAINLRAPFLLGQAVSHVMKEAGGGRIINIASQMATIAEQDLAIYGLSKAALVHLGMSMAFELAPFGIVVNTVSPGPTMTEYNRERTTLHPEYKAHKLKFLRSGRYCTPEEIAETVLFLATTRATNLLGHNLIVDGGYVIQ